MTTLYFETLTVVYIMNMYTYIVHGHVMQCFTKTYMYTHVLYIVTFLAIPVVIASVPPTTHLSKSETTLHVSPTLLELKAIHSTEHYNTAMTHIPMLMT